MSNRNVLGNIGWLVSDRVLNGVVALLVGAWVARHLGPVDFGALAYALSIVAILGAVTPLGFNNTVVRDLVKAPDQAPVILGSAAVALLASSVAGTALVAGFAWLALPPDDPTRMLLLVLAFTLLFRPSDLVNYWFQARVESRYFVWATNAAFLLGTAAKVAAILAGAGVLVFAVIAVVEAALVAAFLFGAYARTGGRVSAWGASVARLRALLADSWPLVLSGVFLSIYMKVDQAMLKHMLGTDAVGQYGAAVRVSESWLALAVILTQSLYPSIVKAREAGRDGYLRQMEHFYALMFWIPVAIGAALALAAAPVIQVLFGAAYADAAGVLRIHAWSGTFVFMITAASRWYLSENLERLLMVRAGIGAAANVALNLVLIPRYGINGAAIATLVSYALITLPFDWLVPAGRPSGRLMLKAIATPPWTLRIRGVP